MKRCHAILENLESLELNHLLAFKMKKVFTLEVTAYFLFYGRAITQP